MPGKSHRPVKKQDEKKPLGATPAPGPSFSTHNLTPSNTFRGPGRHENKDSSVRWQREQGHNQWGTKKVTPDREGTGTKYIGTNEGTIEAGYNHSSNTRPDGKKYQAQVGARVDLKNPLNTSLGGSMSSTDKNGNTRGNTVAVSRNGVNAGRTWTDKNGNSRNAGLLVGDNEAGINGGFAKTSKGGTRYGASGSVVAKLGLARHRKVDQNASTPLDATIHELAGDVAVVDSSTGLRVGATVNAQGGIVGGEVSAHYAQEAGTHFFTPHANRADPERMQKDGWTARSLQDLDLQGLRDGEGFALNNSSAAGAGAGVTVYGIGVGGEGSSSDSQQTVVVKTDDGYVVDITTTDAWTAGANVNALGGAARLGGQMAGGEASRVRFSAGDEAMAAFQRTGILPGAVDLLPKGDPRRAIYDEVVRSGKPLSSSDQKALNDLATEINPLIMSRDPRRGLPSAEGAEYAQLEQGRRDRRSANVSVMGWDLLGSGVENNRSEMAYRERGVDMRRLHTREHSDYWFAADETANHVLNAPGGQLIKSQTQVGNSHLSWNMDRQAAEMMINGMDEDFWQESTIHSRLQAWKNQREVYRLAEQLKKGVGDPQIVAAAESLQLQMNPPLQDPASALQQRQPANFQQMLSVPNELWHSSRAWQQHRERLTKLNRQYMGLMPGMDQKRAHHVVDQMSPQMVEILRRQITTQQLRAQQNHQARADHHSRVGDIRSYGDFLQLNHRDQGEVLRHVPSEKELALILADPDPHRQQEALFSWFEQAEQGKGADATEQGVRSLIPLMKYMSRDGREAFADSVKVK